MMMGTDWRNRRRSTIYSRSLSSQETTAPTIGSIVRVKTARPAAWSTATIFDEPSFGSRPESRTSRGYQEILHLMLGITRLCRRLFERVGWICLSWNKSYGIVTTTVASASVSRSFNAR